MALPKKLNFQQSQITSVTIATIFAGKLKIARIVWGLGIEDWHGTLALGISYFFPAPSAPLPPLLPTPQYPVPS
ncbi:hypothetical protein [Nostoc sp.]|uniref:hypothetical protein n=1 Tax=Nostoc sp. TaxID=1180 RepID=UPI002FFB8838